VDKKNGTVLWQDKSPTEALLNAPKGAAPAGFFKELVNRGQLIQHGQWSNPAYAVVNGEPQVVFPGGDGWIYSFDPQGKLIWKFDCNPKAAEYVLRKGERSDFIATPVIYKNRVYIGTGQDPEHGWGIGHFWCIDMNKKGDVSSELRLANGKIEPNPNSAKVWHYGGAITDQALQRKLKRNYHFGRTMSTAAVHDDLAYICDLGGVLHCMDAKTGEHFWEFDTGNDTWSSPYVADGKVYLGNDSQTVYVFQHGKQLKKLAEMDMGARVRATPIAANGVLYVMTENKLYAIADKK
jgi:outer membrane protein assembly factor BamB